MQLNLFQWDLVAVANGYQRLAAFDFSGAREHFGRVLAVSPDHAGAGRGMADAGFWEATLAAAEGMTPEAALLFWWAKIREFPFGDHESRQPLRMALLRRLLAMPALTPEFYRPPDLCRGYLWLQLGDYSAATAELRALLAARPDQGRLWGYLGDALWMQRQAAPAGAAYVRALLLAPQEVAVVEMRHRELADLIREHGPEAAPAQAFLAGLLPLAVVEAGPRQDREWQTYQLLRQAEQARSQADHGGMVAARRALKQLAPDLLTAYLAWLKQ